MPEVAKAILNLLATGPLTGLAAESLPIFALIVPFSVPP